MLLRSERQPFYTTVGFTLVGAARTVFLSCNDAIGHVDQYIIRLAGYSRLERPFTVSAGAALNDTLGGHIHLQNGVKLVAGGGISIIFFEPGTWGCRVLSSTTGSDGGTWSRCSRRNVLQAIWRQMCAPTRVHRCRANVHRLTIPYFQESMAVPKVWACLGLAQMCPKASRKSAPVLYINSMGAYGLLGF